MGVLVVMGGKMMVVMVIDGVREGIRGYSRVSNQEGVKIVYICWDSDVNEQKQTVVTSSRILFTSPSVSADDDDDDDDDEDDEDAIAGWDRCDDKGVS